MSDALSPMAADITGSWEVIMSWRILLSVMVASVLLLGVQAVFPTGGEAVSMQGVAGAAEETESTGGEKIEWGKETCGLVANLRVRKTEVKSGEPIEFEIRVKNVSDRDSGLPSGFADEKMSPCFWTFYFDHWEWRTAHLSARIVPLTPGETVSVRCLVATTRDSMTAEQKERHFFTAPFRHMQNKNVSDRLPEGTYRVRAIYNGDDGIKSNTIEVRITDGR